MRIGAITTQRWFNFDELWERSVEVELAASGAGRAKEGESFPGVPVAHLVGG